VVAPARDTASLRPEDEAERLASVRRYQILDTPPDGAFDRITALAARIFGVPISIVSVVDEDRIWFKSHHGLPGVDEIGRDPGLCASAILQHEPWIVTDAAADARTLANPLVAGEFGLRFYAGAPLTTAEGHNLGTLCIIDTEPREVTEEETATLRDLARIVVDELELRLAALREEERLHQARNDFLTVASHELRTPLTSVSGAAKTLRSAVLDDRQRDALLEVLDEESERLSRIVNDVLFASDLEHRQVRILDELVDPVAVVGRVADAARAELPDNLELRVVVPDGDVRAIASDAGRVLQVLQNLVGNAIKYSPDGGVIEIGVAVEPERVCFWVADEGLGISAAEEQRIFEKFYRGDPEQTQGTSGTGLGLFIASRLATQLGGNLSLDPSAERGSTFRFNLRG
jgi:signal transduction histidine kinase